ncbi:MAG: hypothetical protein JWM56_1221 [Candidatus Peribacteria bacterium]|nr:hypothetical protein [Candidatus Peribacteria bacterium]
MLHFMQEVWPNLKLVGGTIGDDMKEAFAKKDPIAIAMLPVLEAVRILVDGPNAIVGGILDDKMEKPNGLRTTQEAGAAIKNLNPLDFHPLRALNNGINAATVWPLDVLKSISGIGNGSRNALQQTFRQAA